MSCFLVTPQKFFFPAFQLAFYSMNLTSLFFNLFILWLKIDPHYDFKAHASVLFFLFKLVESTFLWKLHDLSNNEEEASDGIRLVPAGLDTILRVKAKQHPMHCDAISKEINLVMTLVTILLTSSRGKLL